MALRVDVLRGAGVEIVFGCPRQATNIPVRPGASWHRGVAIGEGRATVGAYEPVVDGQMTKKDGRRAKAVE
jgi:hypothetical protein